MYITKTLFAFSIFLAVPLTFVADSEAQQHCCCECGCAHKLKKSYRPVVSFKEARFACRDYCTACRDVPAPTSTCCKKCGSCHGKCGCFGRPTTISVPVAVPHKCHECTRMVPVVSWVAEYKCETCCESDHKHHGRRTRRRH